MTATVHTFPVLADPPGLIEARAAFRSPDKMPLDVLDTAAAVLRHSPHADDRLIAREWGNRLAEQMALDHAEWSDEGRAARARRWANLDRIAGWIGYAVVILFTAWIAVEITESVRRNTKLGDLIGGEG